MKLRIGTVPGSGLKMLALMTEDGEVFPNQGLLTIKSAVGERTKVIVEFAVDGKSVSIDELRSGE